MYTWPVESKHRVDFSQEDSELALIEYSRNMTHVSKGVKLETVISGDPIAKNLQASIMWKETESH